MNSDFFFICFLLYYVVNGYKYSSIKFHSINTVLQSKSTYFQKQVEIEKNNKLLQLYALYSPFSDQVLRKNYSYVEINQKKSLNINQTSQKLYISQYIDGHGQSRTIHIQLYRKWFMKYIPNIIRPKPIAKVGVRCYSTSTTRMTETIENIFTNVTQKNDNIIEYNENKKSIPVAIFLYMWVNPRFRGIGLGDILLNLAYKEIRRKGLGEYMLLIHDDQGSGKLIEYYKSRGFTSVEEIIPKGMIIKVPSES